MVISKDRLQYIIDGISDQVDVADVCDKILLMAKIDQAVLESEQGLGQDWEEFKEEWLKEDQ